MNEQDKFTVGAPSGEPQPQTELSPTEKIEGEPPPGSVTPGAQKPDSEVQNEVNPNTE